MATGYTRNDTSDNIANGKVIDADDLDGEFNAIQSAFGASTGHDHDGTTGGGAPVTVVGPAQDVVVSASAMAPKTDSAYELGTTTLRWSTGYLDSLVLTNALPVAQGGTGSTTASAARTALGLAIGTDVQAWSTVLDNTTASYTTAEETKLAGIETGATADQTGAEIKTAYEAEADTNAYTDAEKSKLAAIEAGATADQTGAEIKIAYEAEADTNAFTDALLSKLNGIEAGADVTDTANVTAAGALMDSEVDEDIKTLSLPANTTISTFGASLVDDADAAAARTTLELGTGATATIADYVPIAGDTTLTGGFNSDPDDYGTITSGTVTLDVTGANKENFKRLVNNGAFTLLPPTTTKDTCVRLRVINGASAGTIDTTAFDRVNEVSAYLTTVSKAYYFYVDHDDTYSVLTITEIV